MKLLYKIALFGLLPVVVGSGLSAQVISYDRRVELLKQADEQILPPTVDSNELVADVASPFIPRVVEEPVQLVAEPEVQQIVKAPELSDEALLKLIARNFKPTGSLVAGDRRLLVLQGGGSLSLGAVFSAKVNDQIHPVEIAEITSSGYTLRLRNVTLSQSFTGSQEGISTRQ